MRSSLPPLSGPVGELQRRGYGEAAVQLVRAWGGGPRYIPFYPRDRSALAKIIGIEAAQALCQIVREDDERSRPAAKGDRGARGRTVDIPSPKALAYNDKAVILSHGGSTREVARDVGCTESYVRQIRAAGGGQIDRRRKTVDARQMDLLDYLKGKG